MLSGDALVTSNLSWVTRFSSHGDTGFITNSDIEPAGDLVQVLLLLFSMVQQLHLLAGTPRVEQLVQLLFCGQGIPTSLQSVSDF